MNKLNKYIMYLVMVAILIIIPFLAIFASGQQENIPTANIAAAKETFELSENPRFKLEAPGGELIAVKVYDANNNEVQLPISAESDSNSFIATLESSRQIRAGRYKIVFILKKDSKDFSIGKSFYWGVLAINTHKSRYLPDENSFIGMAVLDDYGNVVCDANLVLNIKDPDNKVTTLTTKNNDIIVSPECIVM